MPITILKINSIIKKSTCSEAKQPGEPGTSNIIMKTTYRAIQKDGLH
jgi:hypothetical protein